MACGYFLAIGLLLTAVSAQTSGGARPPLLISAERIILDEQFSEPYSEQGFTFTPAGAVRDWVKTRLRADGTPGIFRVILLDARMTRQELKTKGGIRGWFTDDQKNRYDARIHVRVEHQPSGFGQSSSQAEAEASGYFTVPEDVTLAQLEKQAADLVRNLMQRTEMELENNMLRHMPGVVR